MKKHPQTAATAMTSGGRNAFIGQQFEIDGYDPTVVRRPVAYPKATVLQSTYSSTVSDEMAGQWPTLRRLYC